MAPISQPATSSNSNGIMSGLGSIDGWLEKFGSAEYAVYKKTREAPHLSYDDWASSEHVLGPYLYYTTLEYLEAESSSDEEDETQDFHSAKHVSPGLPEREPKKSVTTNGHRISHSKAKASATPSAAKQAELASAIKQKRRRRKKYLSEKIVASDGEDVEGARDSTLVDDVASPPVPAAAAAVSDRRKSSGRKQRRKYLSEEFLAPEDLEEDESAAIAASYAPAPAVNTPKGHGRGTAVTTPSAARPRTSSGRKPKKKYISEEIVVSDDDDESVPEPPAQRTPAPEQTPRSSAKRATPASVAPSESPDGTSPASQPSRRGLRVRTPAQQRPYFHHAKLFEEAEPANPDPAKSAKSSPRVKSTKLAQVSYPEEDSELLREDPQDDEEEDEDEDEDDEEDSIDTPNKQGRKGPRHFKGKGRAWKKNESDEDLDYVSPVKTKAAAPKAKTQPKRKGGRPRKNPAPPVQTHIHDDNALIAEHVDNTANTDNNNTNTNTNTATEGKDGDVEMTEAPPLAPPLAQTTPKKSKGGRPRKSDQSATSSKAGGMNDEMKDEELSAVKKSAPKKQHKRARISASPDVAESRPASPPPPVEVAKTPENGDNLNDSNNVEGEKEALEASAGTLDNNDQMNNNEKNEGHDSDQNDSNDTEAIPVDLQPTIEDDGKMDVDSKNKDAENTNGTLDREPSVPLSPLGNSRKRKSEELEDNSEELEDKSEELEDKSEELEDKNDD